MSTFLTGDNLNNAIDDIITNAKKFIIITSPYIKLDDHFKERFNLIKNNPSIYLQILFGKNEDNFYRSMKSEDLDYFKSFPNVSIMYEPRLHAKSYVNESEGIITSMNLYDYSAENNVEYGVAFSKITLTEKVYQEHADEHYFLLEDSAHCVYIKRPVFKKALLGLSKNYLRSEVLLDLFETFDPNKKGYERVVYQDIDVMSLDDKEVVPVLKTRSEKRLEKDQNPVIEIKPKTEKVIVESKKSDIGYCIRTGEEIPFNPERPFCYKAYKSWAKFENHDFPEKYCHKTGKASKGGTSMANPILGETYKNSN
ncbi:phospholipase D family protein [Algibacter lectus]|uniref:phospholipase D family protein n=1 Tax=Algibacter lectus TaxID=221126 RepID=UPI0026EC4B26|nr:phospholipase D family protein [Algibacter lectus]MDO7135956.1 phospholipase D family protein [Algibacter lectus]